jgi:hypothetical protein
MCIHEDNIGMYVNNMVRPEACTAKSHMLEEAIGLVSEFMTQKYEPVHDKVWAGGLPRKLLERSFKVRQPQPLLHPT